LATDLGRHLRFEPVTARPPTWRYRIGRFLRRHRGRVLAATALVVLGGAGVAGVAWFASLAEEQATMVRARDEAVAHTQGLAREEAAEAGRQRSRAEQLADEVALRAAALERERGELQRLDQLARHEAERAKASADDATAARAELVRERAAVAGLQRDLETAQTELAAAHRRAEDAAAAAAFAESGRGWLQALAAAEQLPSAWSRRGKGVAADPDGTLAQAYARLQALREAPSADPLLASLRPVGAGVAARLGELLAFEALDADAAQDPAWDAAIDAIERADGVVASSDYRGMPRLQRQRGLVPIGCNPRTKLWEFYLPAAATGSALMRAAGVVPRPTIAARGALRLQGGQGVVFVLLPGGKRKLGAQSQAAKAAGYDPAARPEEGPVHEVELAPFFVATHELTRGQWERLGGRLPPRPEVAAGDRSQAELLPIVDVSWLEVQAVLGRHRLSLPTEAQWEYVCRSATETPWWTGRELATLDVAMHLSRLDTKLQRMLCNRCKLTRTVSQGPGDVRCLRCTQPMVEVVGDQRQGLALLTGVGQREPNLFGCFDVHGNAAEWCQDEFVSYRDSKPRPGDGMRSGAGTSSRVVRGGLVGPDDARSSSRAQAAEHLPCARVGVRLVLPLIGGGTATPQSSR
jgi:formylglycine-generating enzyme required for sulfatase activity